MTLNERGASQNNLVEVNARRSIIVRHKCRVNILIKRMAELHKEVFLEKRRVLKNSWMRGSCGVARVQGVIRSMLDTGDR